jgi:TonB-dependent receptor
MMRFLFALVLGVSLTSAAGQGTIRGKMTDAQTGETLIGANVVIKNPYKGAMADIDGNYSLENLAPGSYEVTGSFIGYTPITETVQVNDGVTLLNFNLYIETYVIEQAAEVVAKVDRSRDVYMENIKKKSAASMDFISSQQIKQTGDSDAAGAIKRVPGVSTVGNFVFVRGLSDRYIKTTLNGAEVPSMNPRRNSIEMDLFPTNLVDNLIIVKTQTANLPGDWAGAYISIETKDFPEQFTLNYSSTLGFNDQTTFRNVLASNEGSTDWMAFDDGGRNMPGFVNGLTKEDWPYQQSASFYDALVYLGYGGQLDTLFGGVVQGGIGTGPGQVPINQILSNLDYSDTSMVNLGGSDGTYLLNQEGLIPVAEVLNDSLTRLGQSFSNTWDVKRRQAPLNYSHSLSLGSQTKLFGRPLGYIFGLRWGQSSQHYDNGEYGRYAGGSIEGTDSLGLERYYDDTRTDLTYKWNALANLSYKVNEFNKISLMAMPNMSATSTTRQQIGINPRDTEAFQQQITHRYEGRELNIFQMRGEHFLPASETEIRWTASHSAGRLNTPDLRVFFNNYDTATVITSTVFTGLDTTYTEEDMLDQINYLIGEGELNANWASDPAGTVATLNAYWENEGEDLQLQSIELDTELDTSYSVNQSLYPSPTRYYRDLYENRTDVKLHVIQPLELGGFEDAKLTGGVSMVRTTRSMQENQFGFEATSANLLNEVDGNLDAYFADSNFVVNPSGNADYITTTLLTDLINTDEASLDVWGAYGMFNFRKNERFSGNFGARLEVADMFIRSRKIDLVDDLTDEQISNLQGGLNETDFMPSFNFTYALGELDAIKLTNLRMSYSRTIARPVFREKAPFRSFNFEWLEVLKGNPELDETKVDNFDLRLERYPNLGEVLSMSVFYKRFTDPIEQTSVLAAVNTEYTWSNIPYANVWGLEFEGRKSLASLSPALSGFGVSGNVTLIKSEARIWEDELRGIRATDPLHPETRPLFGQSPYIVNAMLTYQNDSANVAAAVSFNVQGEKLLLVTEGGTPDIYQQPTPTLDVNLTKGFGENFKLRLRGQNLLNPLDRKTYEFNGASYNWLANSRGRTYSVTLSYSI